MKICSIPTCDSPAKTKGLCNRHYLKFWKYGNAIYGKTKAKNGTGYVRPDGYHMVGEKLTHIAVVEAVLGHALPVGAVVHHVDHDPLNNAKSNLVVCPNQAYHVLLHVREEALNACGNADFRKCHFCSRWDDPGNMIPKKGHGFIHRQCRANYMKQYRAKLKESKHVS